MTRTIELPDAVYERLASLARPFEDTSPADVIIRLIDQSMGTGAAPISSHRLSRSRVKSLRYPRERGVRILLDGHEISAHSVRDLFEQVLTYLAKENKLNGLKKLLPYKTSASRYFVSTKPVHPAGNEFVVPVGQHGLYMEAHKSYATALSQLATLLQKLGVKLDHVA